MAKHESQLALPGGLLEAREQGRKSPTLPSLPPLSNWRTCTFPERKVPGVLARNRPLDFPLSISFLSQTPLQFISPESSEQY